MKKKLGEILVEAGAVAPADIDAALSDQSAGEPARLGDLLVSLGKITPTQLGEALAVQHGVPFVDLPRITQAVLQTVPLLFQQQHRLVPFAVEGDTLSVAVADPSEAGGLAVMLKRKVKVHIAAGDEIDAIHAIAADASLARASPPTRLSPAPTAAELFGTTDVEPGPTKDIDEIFADLEGSPPPPGVQPSAPRASSPGQTPQPSPPPIAPVVPPLSPPSARRPAGSSDLFTMLSDPPPQALGAPWESKARPVPLGADPETPSGLWDIAIDTRSSESLAAEAAAAQSPVEELEVTGEQEIEAPPPITAPHAQRISTQLATAVTPVPPVPAVAPLERPRVEPGEGASLSGMFELKDVPEAPLPASSLDSLLIAPDVPVKPVPSPVPAIAPAKPSSTVMETRAEGARKIEKVERRPEKPSKPPEKPVEPPKRPRTSPSQAEGVPQPASHEQPQATQAEPDEDLPDWLQDAAEKAAVAPAGEQWVIAGTKTDEAWTGALGDIAPSKLIMAAVRALVEKGVLTEQELLALLGKK